MADGGDPRPAAALGVGLGAGLCLWKVFQALSTPLASCKIKHLYLREGFVLEAVLQTSHPLLLEAFPSRVVLVAALSFGVRHL